MCVCVCVWLILQNSRGGATQIWLKIWEVNTSTPLSPHQVPSNYFWEVPMPGDSLCTYVLTLYVLCLLCIDVYTVEEGSHASKPLIGASIPS